MARKAERLTSHFGIDKGNQWYGLTAVGIRCADHATPSTRKRWH
jgi:hypothetical protein